MVYRMELTYDEIIDLLFAKYIAGTTIGYVLPLKIYEISDICLMTKSSFPINVEIIFTRDEIR